VQVLVLLLLVAGLALLVLGLITGSTPLVVGSIVASLLAAMAVRHYRGRQQADGVGASSEPSVTPPAVTRPAVTPEAVTPEAARHGAALRTAEPIPVLASVVSAEPAQVAVPLAHAAAEPDRVAAEPARAHPDEVTDTDPAVADTDPPLRSRGDESVWVIDGRPRYHLPGCAFLISRGPEPVPLRQAVEDGFTPCALCDPDSGLAAR
jgi:hypothetical protein